MRADLEELPELLPELLLPELLQAARPTASAAAAPTAPTRMNCPCLAFVPAMCLVSPATGAAGPGFVNVIVPPWCVDAMS